MRVYNLLPIITTFFLAGFISGLPFPVMAAPKVSMDEMAVFALHRLAQKEPQYIEWIRKSPRYKNALDEKDRERIFDNESARLRYGFGTYVPARDFLHIKSHVQLRLEQDPVGTRLIYNFIGGNNEQPYFPFPYGEEWVALIIDKLTDPTILDLSAAEAQPISHLFSPNKILNAELILHVRPIKADMTSALVINQQKLWPLFGEIGYLKLQIPGVRPSTKPQMVYSRTAPWYMTKEEQGLLDLLNEEQNPKD